MIHVMKQKIHKLYLILSFIATTHLLLGATFQVDDVIIYAIKGGASMITNTNIAPIAPTTISQYTIQYADNDPNIHYLNHITVDDAVRLLPTMGVRYLILTKDLYGDQNLFELCREGHPVYRTTSIQNSTLYFDGMMRRLDAVNYIVSSDRILETIDDDDDDDTMSRDIPEFAIYRLPTVDAVKNVKDTWSYLSQNCIISNYPPSFVAHNWSRAWEDLSKLISDDYNKSVSKKTYTNASGSVGVTDSTLFTMYIQIVDVLRKCSTFDSSNETVRACRILGGDLFVDHDDRLNMKPVNNYQNPIIRFVSETNGTFVAHSLDGQFRADYTLSSEHYGTNTTTINLSMKTGDSITISTPDNRFDEFCFTQSDE